MPCHILGDIRLDPILVLGGPVEEMRGIGAAHHVDRVNTARLLLVDALIDTLGAGAFDPDGNAGIFRLEGAGQPFRSVELQRGIEAGVAFLFCGLDQRRRHGTRRRRRGFKRLRKNGSRAKSNTGLEHGAARYMLVVHAVPPGCCLPLMGKSDGKSIPAVRAVRSRESEKARFETRPFPSLAGMSALDPKRTNHRWPKSTVVRFGRWSQLIDATLYLKRKRWSVWRCGKDIVEVSLRQRRQSCGTAGSGGSRSKRLGGRLASRHLPFIAKSHRTGGFVLRHGVARGWH